MAAYRSIDGTLVCHRCEGCEHEPGGCQALDVLESAESLLAAFGSDFAVEFTDTMPERLIVDAAVLEERVHRAEKQSHAAADAAAEYLKTR